MEFPVFLDRLARDQRPLAALKAPEQATDLASYLCALAARILTGLGEAPAETACRRLAAVSGLVRACPPGALIILESPTTPVLAAALIDITAPRRIVPAEQADDGRWRAVAVAEMARGVEKLAEKLSLSCLDLQGDLQDFPSARAMIRVSGSPDPETEAEAPPPVFELVLDELRPLSS